MKEKILQLYSNACIKIEQKWAETKLIDKYIDGDETIFEKDSLEKIADDGQLMAYKHDGFWQCMDTQRDKELLEKLWKKGQSPWKKWD